MKWATAVDRVWKGEGEGAGRGTQPVLHQSTAPIFHSSYFMRKTEDPRRLKIRLGKVVS